MRLFLAILLWSSSASAGKRKDAVVAPEPVFVAPQPDSTPWFSTLPFPYGVLPAGIANSSAQACAACHPVAYERWSADAHSGPPSPALLTAAAALGESSCTACHLPQPEQRPWTGTFGFGVEQPTSTSQPFSATLWNEGVSCGTCHVRDGVVLATRPASGPHPVRFSSTLGSSEGCATCHQLNVDGVAAYDTFGEWSRSPYADGGVGCVDCHASAGHKTSSSRAVSLLVDVEKQSLTRGGEPLEVQIVLQNTGAGHHYPTGSPYRGVQLRAALIGPVDPESQTPVQVAIFSTELKRSVDATWNTVEDTRIAAMGTARFDWSPALPADAPAGPWHLEVSLYPTTSGNVEPQASYSMSLPLTVD